MDSATVPARLGRDLSEGRDDVEAYAQTDRVSGVRLFGGEMLGWSDLTATPVPAVVRLLRQQVGAGVGSILLVGPRAAMLVDHVPEVATVDVVVRGLPDARRLAVASQLRSGVTVHCGSLDRFAPADPFDVVVLLDAPEVLSSPDGQVLSPADLLHRLATWLGESGVLVARVDNELGVERLFAFDVSTRRGDDAAWGWEAQHQDTRALYLRELPGQLAAAGLVAGVTCAALPAGEDPSLLVSKQCVQSMAQSGARRGYREAVDAGIQLEHELETPSAKVDWLAVTLAARDVRLSKLETEMDRVRGSLSFRLGQAASRPARSVGRRLRHLVMYVLPMDLVRKAETFARQMLDRSA